MDLSPRMSLVLEGDFELTPPSGTVFDLRLMKHTCPIMLLPVYSTYCVFRDTNRLYKRFEVTAPTSRRNNPRSPPSIFVSPSALETRLFVSLPQRSAMPISLPVQVLRSTNAAPRKSRERTTRENFGKDRDQLWTASPGVKLAKPASCSLLWVRYRGHLQGRIL